MMELSGDLHNSLNSIAIALLRNARITTVADFVRTDANILCGLIKQGTPPLQSNESFKLLDYLNFCSY